MMKKPLYLLTFLILGASLLITNVNAANAQPDKTVAANASASKTGGIQWVQYSPDTFKEAKSAKKLIIIFAMSDTCRWCKEMEKKTFKSRALISLVNDKYFPVMLHADKDTDTADKYHLESVPVIMVIDPDGSMIAQYKGYSAPEVLIVNLDTLAKKNIVE